MSLKEQTWLNLPGTCTGNFGRIVERATTFDPLTSEESVETQCSVQFTCLLKKKFQKWSMTLKTNVYNMFKLHNLH